MEARRKWNTVLKEKKAGFYGSSKASEQEQVSRAIREMNSIGKRKNKPSESKSPPNARKPKKRLHS